MHVAYVKIDDKKRTTDPIQKYTMNTRIRGAELVCRRLIVGGTGSSGIIRMNVGNARSTINENCHQQLVFKRF